jgi:hypothetical protein
LASLGFIFQSQEDTAASPALTSANPLIVRLICNLGFPKRPVTPNLPVSHQSKAYYDSDPVQVV